MRELELLIKYFIICPKWRVPEKKGIYGKTLIMKAYSRVIMDDKQKILNVLKSILDPEIGYDIVSLGMVEELRIEDNKVYVKFLPTTPMCPYLPYLIEAITIKIRKLGYDVEIEIDFENQWSPERIDPEIRKKFNMQ